uniref:Signal transducing adapter molecule 1 n=1 Tax=Lygus hesperus TaxID=30085 RepID=A0A0A9WPQ0_LYGHE
MGLTSYFTASPFDTDVEKATHENNTKDDWALIMDICDKVGNSQPKAKECLRSIIKRLNNQDPHVVLQAVTLLDACVSNCGKSFQLEVASREFESEMKKVVKKWPPSSGVGSQLRILVKKWSEAEFKSDPQLSLLTSMWGRMKSDGIDLTIHADPTTTARTSRPVDPDTVASQQEVDDIAKAIELSLKETSSPKAVPPSSSGLGSLSTSSSLYPSIGGMASSVVPSASEPRKVRALYDFEAAEENELTFFAGEIIHVLDDSDANWWKGCNQRGEGLFPNNFVTSDLNSDPNKLNKSDKKGVQFNETVEVKAIARIKATEIDEGKIDRVLHLLHEADPNVDTLDPPELQPLEEDVMEMGPLIDNELEKVDRKHAQLTQLSGSLVEAMNMYHSLLREPSHIMAKGPPPPMGPGMYHTLPGHGSLHHGPPPGPQSLPIGPPGMGVVHPQQPVGPGVFSPPGHHPGQPIQGQPQPHEFPMYQTMPPQHTHNMYQNGPPSHFYPPPPN